MTATDRAYAFAKERVLDGRFAGGQLISEGDVAAGVGVSRTPVREAFLRLESEGLLHLYPKRGALVVPVSVAEVESVMETRLVIERHAIEKVIRLRIDIKEPLDAAIARQKALTGPEHAQEFVDADREFHRIFVAEAGNTILLQLHDSLRDRQSRMGLTALLTDGGRLEQILAEHRAIVDAVAEGDEELARTLVDRHLDATLQLLRRSPGAPPARAR